MFMNCTVIELDFFNQWKNAFYYIIICKLQRGIHRKGNILTPTCTTALKSVTVMNRDLSTAKHLLPVISLTKCIQKAMNKKYKTFRKYRGQVTSPSQQSGMQILDLLKCMNSLERHPHLAISLLVLLGQTDLSAVSGLSINPATSLQSNCATQSVCPCLSWYLYIWLLS